MNELQVLSALARVPRLEAAALRATVSLLRGTAADEEAESDEDRGMADGVSHGERLRA